MQKYIFLYFFPYSSIGWYLADFWIERLQLSQTALKNLSENSKQKKLVEFNSCKELAHRMDHS